VKKLLLIFQNLLVYINNVHQGILRTIDELMKPEINQNANEPFEQRPFKKKKRLGQRL
jgi:hypothetical protein